MSILIFRIQWLRWAKSTRRNNFSFLFSVRKVRKLNFSNVLSPQYYIQEQLPSGKITFLEKLCFHISFLWCSHQFSLIFTAVKDVTFLIVFIKVPEWSPNTKVMVFHMELVLWFHNHSTKKTYYHIPSGI